MLKGEKEGKGEKSAVALGIYVRGGHQIKKKIVLETIIGWSLGYPIKALILSITKQIPATARNLSISF